MLLCCSRCHNEFVAFREPADNKIICAKCCEIMGNSAYTNKLGLHPALERHWQSMVSPIKNNRASEIANRKTLFNQKLKDSEALSELPKASYSPKIPGYDIYYEIGRGAMGSVLKAKKLKEGQMVAIKILSQELSNRTDLVARFEREIFALRSLKHKNIVSIIDSGSIDRTHYFTMEFIDGITLRTRMNRGNIDFSEASFITSEILEGLKFAHAHGIIHRDLKPENVLLAYDDQDFSKMPSRVVLADFGLVGIGALGFDPHPNLTRSKVTMGTVNYMAPEQHIDAKRVDLRSDIYSCGVILFEMLTSDLPIGRYLMPNERGIKLPLKTESILAKSLARTPKDRYASCEHFLADLASINKAQEAEENSHIHSTSLVNKSINYYKNHSGPIRYTILVVFSLLFFSFGIKLSINS